MTTPSKACVFGLLGSCKAAGFATCARFGVSTSMDKSLSNSSRLSRKDKSNNLVLVAVQNQKPAPTFFAVSEEADGTFTLFYTGFQRPAADEPSKGWNGYRNVGLLKVRLTVNKE
jgi:hypothetical protein